MSGRALHRFGVAMVSMILVFSLPVCPSLGINYDMSEIDGDGIDNDGDGYIDSADTECGSHYQGYGSRTSGGAGGRVFWVDVNLGDPVVDRQTYQYADSHAGTHDDPCSLRKALDGPNRVIKFVNGGTITLLARLTINDNNITVDGFSAPAPGVTITYTPEGRGGIGIGAPPGEHTHDILLNHLRLDGLWEEGFQHRLGWGLLWIWASDGKNKVSNVILDHLSLRDDQDKFTIWGQVQDVTVSNCLFYHSGKAMLISYYRGRTHDQWRFDIERKNLSVFRNVYAENDERNPQLRGWISNLDFVNNITYGWGGGLGTARWGYGMRIKSVPGERPICANVINNYFVTRDFNPTHALIYGMVPGADEDGGPNVDLPQGAIYTKSNMGQLWVAGNVLPPQNRDHYSTVSQPLTTPNWAALPTLPTDELYLLVPQAGMQHKDARELNVLGRVMRAAAPSAVLGRYVATYNPRPAPTPRATPTTRRRRRRGRPKTGTMDKPPYVIDADKAPLMPGQTATAANYTTDQRGITCILVDTIGMEGVTGIEDFAFRIGIDGDPAEWPDAPDPTILVSRERGGVLGADRWMIVWPDGAIVNTYFQVTIKATPNTHLKRDEVFYFGSFPAGESVSLITVP